MAERTCCYCGTAESELRPYGPGGSDVCFSCAMAPGRKAQTEAAFARQLGMAGPAAVLDASEEVGPRSPTPAEAERIREVLRREERGEESGR